MIDLDEMAASWRRLSLAAILLLSALPLGDFVNTHCELSLRRSSAAIATVWLRSIGIAARRTDTTLVTNAGEFTVLLPCSGGKFLAATLALGLASLAIAPVGWRRRLVLVLALVPIAVAGNALRVAGLVACGGPSSPAVHTGLGVVCFGLVAVVVTGVAGVAQGNRSDPATRL